MDQDYRFELPPELIAQDPAVRRTDSRLLLVRRGVGVAGERRFGELERVLRPGDLLVLNDSRVLPARLRTRRPRTGGRVEILLLSPAADERTWLAMARPARRMAPGVELELIPGPGSPSSEVAPRLEIVGKTAEGTVLVRGPQSLARIAEQWGEIPLPPYIRRDRDDPERAAQDRQRYQTVYALADPSGAGSVAAPTAGLHFSDGLLERLEGHGVSTARVALHVGPGTFQPPSSEQIEAGRLHRETFTLPAETWRALRETRERGGRVIAVGTTSLRVLETVARLDLAPSGPAAREFLPTAAHPEPVFEGTALRADENWSVQGATRLFIQPPQEVTAVDGLLTNFHLPGSSLLMLVAALVGPAPCAAAYEHAVREKFRFYSYGDCMLVLDDPSECERV